MSMPHAIIRARQRYGLELTLADLDAIRANIAAGQSILCRRDRRGEVHIVKLGEICLLAVVDHDNAHVRTVLAPGRYRRTMEDVPPCAP